MIEVQNLTKRYGSKVALNDVSFTVNQGEILGFLGPNGAGKSTTMNILTGYLSSSSGAAKIGGKDILDDPMGAKSKIGYLPEQPPLYLDMTVSAYLNFVYDLKKCKLPRKAHLQEICDLVKISDVSHRLIKNLSKGYRQRVGLAQALVGNPDVLILDEPTVGLDPKQIIEIRNVIKKLGKKHTIILSSHILPEIQATCDRVVVINNGNIVADDTPDNLSQNLSHNARYTVRIQGPENEVRPIISSIQGMKKVDCLGEREPGVFEYLIESAEGSDVRNDLFKRLSERNWPLLGLQNSALNLEDIFLQLTKDNAAPPVLDKKAQKEARKQAEAILEEHETEEIEKIADEAAVDYTQQSAQEEQTGLAPEPQEQPKNDGGDE
ncbi:MAG: ABC-type multidrug transport system, ATPase component [Oscillospiraceae bacterium]|nr:ABC-type multidrug transport system, ATPase component [Oscillospiraceae bacterium]